MVKNLKIKVIIGSTRQNRFSEYPAHWIFNEIKNREGVDAELLDLRDYPMPFYNDPVTPKRMNGNYNNEVVITWAVKIKEADGFLVVTPEYNHGYPAVLKNALDSVYIEWAHKPIGFLSYGTVGGARSVEQLRNVAVELQMVPTRNSVNIAAHWKLQDEQGNIKEHAFDEFKKDADILLEELIWWGKTLKPARNQQ